MRILTNNKRYKLLKTIQIINLTAFGSITMMLFLTITLVVTYTYFPHLITSYIPIIILGIVSTIIGISLGNFVKNRPDSIVNLSTNLKGIPKNSLLLNYISPVHHLLITPTGIFTVLVIPYKTHFNSVSSKFKTTFFTKFFNVVSGTYLRKPLIKAHKDLISTQAWLNNLINDKYTIHPIVFLTHIDATTDSHVINNTHIITTSTKPSLKSFVKSTHDSSYEKLLQLLSDTYKQK